MGYPEKHELKLFSSMVREGLGLMIAIYTTNLRWVQVKSWLSSRKGHSTMATDCWGEEHPATHLSLQGTPSFVSLLNNTKNLMESMPAS